MTAVYCERYRTIGRRFIARVAAAILVAMLAATLALPAQAHTFWVSCSASYDPWTWSIAQSTGKHTHSYQWVVSQSNWPANVYLVFAWDNIGARFGTASGPGSHNGFYTCN